MSSSSGAIAGTTPSTAGRTPAGRGRRTGHRVSGVAVALGCVLFIGGFVWGVVIYRPYTVPTDSMVPAVQPGDRVLARTVSGSDAHRGDVVVFKDPLWGNQPLVKRVIGVGGDKIACCDARGRLTVNGKPVDETYLKGGGPASLEPFVAVVPPHQLFLLGDNRAVSEDSRLHLADAAGGSVPVGDVRGRVDGTAWPASRIGVLSPTSAFDALPGGRPGDGPLGRLALAVLVGAALILGGAAYEPVAKLLRRR